MGREREGSPPEDEQRPDEAEGGAEEEDEAAGEDTDEDSGGNAQDSGDDGGTETVVPRGRYDRVEQDNKKLRERLKQIDDASKSEQQKLQEERDNLRETNQRLQTRVRRANFIEQVGVSSPRLAWAALQDLSLDVEWDDKDQASNLPDIRKALKKEFPEDFGDKSVNGGETGQAPASDDMNARIRAATGR